MAAVVWSALQIPEGHARGAKTLDVSVCDPSPHSSAQSQELCTTTVSWLGLSRQPYDDNTHRVHASVWRQEVVQSDTNVHTVGGIASVDAFVITLAMLPASLAGSNIMCLLL